MTKAETIVAKAKKELVDFICFEAPLLYKKFDWGEPDEDEDYVISTDYLCRSIYINVEVDNSYLDIEDNCYERREVAEIIVSREGEVWVNTEVNDYTIDEISVEELADVAEVLELTYNRK